MRIRARSIGFNERQSHTVFCLGHTRVAASVHSGRAEYDPQDGDCAGHPQGLLLTGAERWCIFARNPDTLPAQP